MGIWRWGLWDGMWSWGWSPLEWISAFKRRAQLLPQCPLPSEDIMRRMFRRPPVASPDTRFASTFTLDFQPPGLWEIHVCRSSHPLHGISVMVAPTDEDCNVMGSEVKALKCQLLPLWLGQVRWACWASVSLFPRGTSLRGSWSGLKE